MTHPLRGELTELKLKQARIQAEIESLNRQILHLDRQITAAELPAPLTSPAATQPPPASEVPSPRPAANLPPILATLPPAPVTPPSPPPAPLLVSPTPPPISTPPPQVPAPAPDPTHTPTPEPPDERSDASTFELRLGTYWFVRIGIVLFLTGLVFFANYAYQAFAHRLGPAVKVSMLYAVGLGLTGLGVWIPRNRAKMTNYGEVLFAGGLASLYFTTYAAHHVERLRIITSPVLDGILLLVWAAAVVFLADRRKSELLALMAVGLAFYTSAITPVTLFTLGSNLVLAAASLVFLARHRWTTLSVATLVGTYVAYAYWRHMGPDAAPAHESPGLQLLFLSSYWICHTTALFLTARSPMQPIQRTMFLTFNNAAFFALETANLLDHQRDRFWLFALAYGLVLLGVAHAARRLIPLDTVTSKAALVQGILLVTLGLIAKLDDPHLAPVLAAESAALWIIGDLVKSPATRRLAFLVSFLALLYLRSTTDGETVGLTRTLAVAGFFLFHAVWERRKNPTPAPWNWPIAWFSALGLLAVQLALRNHLPEPHIAVATALVGLALTLSIRLHRVPEITLLAQLFLLRSQLEWLLSRDTTPAAEALLIVGIGLGAAFWWNRQRSIDLPNTGSLPIQLIIATGVILVINQTLLPRLDDNAWLAVGAITTLGLSLFGAATRQWPLFLATQLLALSLCIGFLRRLEVADASWAMFPPLTLVLLGLLSARLQTWLSQGDAPPTQAASTPSIALIQTVAGLGLFLVWTFQHIAAQHRFWFLLAVAWVPLLWGMARGGGMAQKSHATLALAAGVGFLWNLPDGPELHLPHLLGILLLLLQQQAVRRRPGHIDLPEPVHAVMVTSGLVVAVLVLTEWVQGFGAGFYVTASWAALAFVVLAAGLALRERSYRWCALVLLALGLGRVVFFDVWQLGTLYRMLSFMALGVVLLVLGFIYSRYQDKIRPWL